MNKSHRLHHSSITEQQNNKTKTVSNVTLFATHFLRIFSLSHTHGGVLIFPPLLSLPCKRDDSAFFFSSLMFSIIVSFYIISRSMETSFTACAMTAV